MLEVEPTVQRGHRKGADTAKKPSLAPLQKHSPGGCISIHPPVEPTSAQAYHFAARYLVNVTVGR